MHEAEGALPMGPGTTGPAVRDLQDRLLALGHLVDRHEVDLFGPSTERAVRAFQEQRYLTSDGTCGKQTWAALVEAGYRLGDRYLYLRTPMLRGDDVAELQRRLSALGFDPGRVDGILGADTERALKDLQRNLALTVDGVCGRDVVAALARLSGRAADGDVAGARERAQLLHLAPDLAGRRIAVGDLGGFDALAHAVCRELTERGAVAITVTEATDEEQAATANALDADAYLGLRLAGVGPCKIHYFASRNWSSPGGQTLATVLIRRLSLVGLSCDAVGLGMSLPLLRETRMPAVLCRLGPAADVVPATADLADAITAALSDWVASPVEP